MGGQNSSIIVDANGQQVQRKCIILVIPPGFQVQKMVQSFPQQFPYRYISIGQLIRNEINKKTKYSKIILQTLEKNKKINKQILQILLRTVALRGNFIIRYTVLDKDELEVWKQFMTQITIQLIGIIKPDQDDIDSGLSSKSQALQRLKTYKNDVKNVKITFQAKQTKQYSQYDDIATDIMNIIRKNNA